MSLNVASAKRLLHNFSFQDLFREELGWNNPKQKQPIPFQTKDGKFYRKSIAELSGAIVFEIIAGDGKIPNANTRQNLSNELLKINFHHILIFVDEERTQTVWRWLKKQDKKNLPREHYYSVGQSGDAFIFKISALLVDISELEDDITIIDVAKKIQKALDIEHITKKFYKQYQQQFIEFLPLIEGIDNESDRRWYASVILNRLMFIYFLQKKGFLDNGNYDYLYLKLIQCKEIYGKDQFYLEFLNRLFFEGFAKPTRERTKETNNILGTIKYLNGGLFLKHKIEEKYPHIFIPDVAFENLLKSDNPKGLFEQFSWSLDDLPGGKDDEINPNVLGYIFEKYINQKAFGAYYTRPEMTEYLCEQTVHKLILDEVNNFKSKTLDYPFASINEVLLNADAATCRFLIFSKSSILPNLKLLDPACGSGAFLVAAMKVLINLYSSLLGRIDYFEDEDLIEWKRQIETEHPSISYFIKKTIITNNLYGVDIMEEASEIAKLRLFLALVSSAQTVEQLEPLPNIDFNIMCGNSLIGLMRVDPNQFNTYNGIGRHTQGKIVKKGDLFEAAVIQGNMFSETHANNYQQLIEKRENSIANYKSAKDLNVSQLQKLRNNIELQEDEAKKILDRILVDEFQNLSIPYLKSKWDFEKNDLGKPEKRAVKLDDIKELEPFHWGYEFSEIFRTKNGFDAILTNPPWEIFKPNSKEFFSEYSEVISKKKMDIHDFEKEQNELLKDPEVREAWLNYLSRFPHTSAYYRSASQYKNQISYINGKKAGSDINLFKLFTEQCYNLLKENGYCGIVIPTGIYTDLGTKQLRKLLFDKCRIQQLIGFANERYLFENVHHAFKFALLSFEKGGETDEFSAAFRINPRECIAADDLDIFLHASENFSKISKSFVFRQSPESLSIMELRLPLDFSITEKILAFQTLGSEQYGDWQFKLTREFDMTNDAKIFSSQFADGHLTLYEGKMIHQFLHKPQEKRFVIDPALGRKSLLGKKEDEEGKQFGYEKFRLGLRAISSSTNTRTLISTILPHNVFAGNSVLVSAAETSYRDQLYLCAFLNSFVVDYYIRQIVSQNINMFYIYQLPIPRLRRETTWYKDLIKNTLSLIATDLHYSNLWENVMQIPWNINSSFTDPEQRLKATGRINAIVAHIYGLDSKELAHILNTFPVTEQAEKDLVLEAFNELLPEFPIERSKFANQNNFYNLIDDLPLAEPTVTMKEFALDEGIYSIQDVVQITRIPAEKISRWFKELSNENYEGLKGKSSDHKKLKISFHGIIELVVIGTLRDNKFPLKKILSARADLKNKTQKIYPFATNNVRDNLKVAGKSLIFKFGDDIVTLDGTGQFNLTIIVSFFKNIDFDTEGLALRLFPLKDSKLIIVDPKLGGGKAVINNGEAIWAETVALAYQGEDSIGVISEQYNISREEILAAVSYLN
ncbi:Eco57I restriction-modification methylase domain-containing protein [Mucilaginibacter litoreus]|uniref:site-specific DNA-methyltransferase (adenine-specific) n=1 Tax=Mucilaginibacter litoreus TaxID=1048221 RepID=A0ABW3AXD2_9SPHI